MTPSLVSSKGQVQSMSDWTPEAMAAEGARRREMRKRGLCPDSGLAVHSCHRGPCDCFEGDDCRRCFPRSSRAEKIRAAVVPEQLDQYLPDEPGPSCPSAFPSDGA